MAQELTKAYLTGYSDGLELMAENLKRFAYGDMSNEQVLATINGAISAMHQAQTQVYDLEGTDDEQLFAISVSNDAIAGILRSMNSSKEEN